MYKEVGKGVWRKEEKKKINGKEETRNIGKSRNE